MQFTFTFTNVGKTPTAGLFIGANIVDGDGAVIDNGRLQCERGKEVATTHPDYFSKFSIIPGGAFVIREAGYYRDNIRSVAATWYPFKLKAMRAPQIVGCVVYRSRFSQEFFQTEFFARLTVPGDKITIDPAYTTDVK